MHVAHVERLTREQSDAFLAMLENNGWTPDAVEWIMDPKRNPNRPLSAAAMLMAAAPDGFWTEQVLADLVVLAGMRFTLRLAKVPGPDFPVNRGELVERALKGWMLYYMPDEKHLPAEKILKARKIFKPYPPALAVEPQKRPEGYWYWFRIRKLLDQVRDQYKTPQALAERCASLEETIVAVLGRRVTQLPADDSVANGRVTHSLVNNAYGGMNPDGSKPLQVNIALVKDMPMVIGWQAYEYLGWWREDDRIHLCQSERVKL
jgi:hypothetical protein